MIEKEIDNVIVEKNIVPSYFVLSENKQQEDDLNQYIDIIQNKPVQYPRIGSFEISLFNITVFSKVISQAWPNIISIINTIKQMIIDKSQNKSITHYSVLKNDINLQQNTRETQNVQDRVPVVSSGRNISRKSGSTSPKPHNGIRMPPIQNQNARSNSPQLRNYISTIDTKKKNDELKNQQNLQSISQQQNDKTLIPLKLLPPLADKQTYVVDGLKQQESLSPKSNFYLQQNQEEQSKQSPSFIQKPRRPSPAHINNYYAGRKPQQLQAQNIKLSTLDQNTDQVGQNENRYQNKGNSQQFQDEKGSESPLQKSNGMFKVRFENQNEIEKNQEKEQIQQTKDFGQKGASFVKKIDLKFDLQAQQSVSPSKTFENIKVKTVRLPNKNIYSNVKKNQNTNKLQYSNGQELTDQYNNPPSIPISKNRPILSNINKSQSKQIIKKFNPNMHQISELGTQEDLSISSLQIDKNNQNIIRQSIENEEQTIKQGELKSLNSKQKNIKEQEKSPNSRQNSKSNNEKQNILQLKPDIDLKALYKKVSSDKIEINNDTNDVIKSMRNTGFDTQTQTINNLSNIEIVNSGINSTSSLFSSNEKKNKYDETNEVDQQTENNFKAQKQKNKSIYNNEQYEKTNQEDTQYYDQKVSKNQQDFTINDNQIKDQLNEDTNEIIKNTVNILLENLEVNAIEYLLNLQNSQQNDQNINQEYTEQD